MVDNGLVFVVDDDDSLRLSLVRLIRSVGLEVEAFPSASDFPSRDLPDRPSCLVLDIRMPGQSGLDLQEELARVRLELPIIFLTGHADVRTTVRAMKAGATDLLEKPFNDQQLLDAVHGALARDSDARGERAQRHQIERHLATLTPREREVLTLVVTGMLNKQIGAQLGTSEKTVKVHRGRVMEKMGANSLAQLVLIAQKGGIAPSNI